MASDIKKGSRGQVKSPVLSVESLRQQLSPSPTLGLLPTARPAAQLGHLKVLSHPHHHYHSQLKGGSYKQGWPHTGPGLLQLVQATSVLGELNLHSPATEGPYTTFLTDSSVLLAGGSLPLL